MTVEFITRANCPLCEKGRAVLDKVAARRSISVIERDVDADPSLAEFTDRVPVVRDVDSGRVLAEGRLSSAGLTVALFRKIQRPR